VGIAGPQTAQVLEKLGAAQPEAGTLRRAVVAGIEAELMGGYSPVVPRAEIHAPAEQVLALWTALEAAGAVPCGAAAMEDLRVLEGVPRFGVDFSDRNLPQEANLFRALHFTKGCYIGQEIVERIRARATVHRTLRQFELRGTARKPAAGETIELRLSGAAAGELTSVAAFDVPSLAKTLALGMVRTEALEASEAGGALLEYDGGVAVPLAGPPPIAQV
jgi:folate-binding protein YgfZ